MHPRTLIDLIASEGWLRDDGSPVPVVELTQHEALKLYNELMVRATTIARFAIYEDCGEQLQYHDSVLSEPRVWLAEQPLLIALLDRLVTAPAGPPRPYSPFDDLLRRERGR